MILTAKVVGEKDGQLWLAVPKPANYQEQRQALIEFLDPRKISPQQRRKAYVLIKYIADWAGYIPQEAEKEILKYMFRIDNATISNKRFSFADCSKTEARLFITWLIDFCLLYDIPIGHDPIQELVEDIPRYVYACLMTKKCAVCGRPADLHHVDRVGMGRNRNTINHIGMRCLPLCRKHHTEAHSIGDTDFMKHYMLETIRINERIAEVYKLNTKDES